MVLDIVYLGCCVLHFTDLLRTLYQSSAVDVFQFLKMKYVSGFCLEISVDFVFLREVSMNLTFQQAARGCNKDIELNVSDTCARCGGDKAEPGTRKVQCHHCKGTGMVSLRTRILFWRISEAKNRFGFVLCLALQLCFFRRVMKSVIWIILSDVD